MQVPTVVYDSVVPEAEQPVAVPSTALYVTAPVPEPPVEARVMGSPNIASDDEDIARAAWADRDTASAAETVVLE